MFQSKSTRNVPYHVFLLSAVSCLGMCHYGMMIENSILIFLNGVGALLQSVYVTMYLMVARPKAKPLFLLSIAFVYDVFLYMYMYTRLNDVAQRADILGLCSSILTTVLMILPVFEVAGNIRLKNADGMPLIMLCGGLMCASCWLVYGLMLNDANIYLPNIPGIAITLVKLYIIYLYAEKKKAD